MFSWMAVFNIQITELAKYSSHFPQLVIIFVCLVRFIFIITKMYKSTYMTETVSFLSVSIKGCLVLFQCWPVIFKHVPMIMSHLHNNCQKQTHVMNCHSRQWGPSFVQCIQVLVIISLCLFHQQLYNFKKEEHENAQWRRVFIDVGCLCLS